MPGFKFGSSGNWEKAVQVNCILPYLVGEQYRNSRIVVFSSANPYAYTTLETGGSKEGDALDPEGDLRLEHRGAGRAPSPSRRKGIRRRGHVTTGWPTPSTSRTG